MTMVTNMDENARGSDSPLTRGNRRVLCLAPGYGIFSDREAKTACPVQHIDEDAMLESVLVGVLNRCVELLRKTREENGNNIESSVACRGN